MLKLPNDWTRILDSTSTDVSLTSFFYLLIECFHSRGQHRCKSIGTKESVCKEKSSTPIGLVWDTNMAAVSLFWDINMAAVTSYENTLFFKKNLFYKIPRYISHQITKSVLNQDSFWWVFELDSGFNLVFKKSEFVKRLGYFRVPKTLTFKTRLSAKSFW